jgi:hypothetical protein
MPSLTVHLYSLCDINHTRRGKGKRCSSWATFFFLHVSDGAITCAIASVSRCNGKSSNQYHSSASAINHPDLQLCSAYHRPRVLQSGLHEYPSKGASQQHNRRTRRLSNTMEYNARETWSILISISTPNSSPSPKQDPFKCSRLQITNSHCKRPRSQASSEPSHPRVLL